MNINDILNQLKNEISQYEYDTYLKLLEFDESASREDLLVFYTPNSFVTNWIEIHYLDKLKSCAQEIIGIPPKIHIKIKKPMSNVKSLKNNKNLKNSESSQQSHINYQETFENFVVGKSNHLAWDSCQKVVEIRGRINPLLIYGHTGVGKTHLLNAIANAVREKNEKVILITAEQFLNDFQLRLNNKTMDTFRNKYRKCDYLLIDDVQFFGGKDQICEEFHNTFNALHQDQKQIVMTSDQPPKKIRGLEERLRSRFEGGIVIEIEKTDLDTKKEIIRSKCNLNSIVLDDETINFIATKLDNSRQILGIIQNINLQSNLNPNITKLEIAISVMKTYQRNTLENITIDKILSFVGKELNIKPSEITSKAKNQHITKARRIATYLTRKLTHNSMPIIANKLNMKDHSSVSKALKAIEEKIKEDENLKNLVEEIENKIKNDNNPQD
ncbi:chromosomal replication initiator protein DnaA [uncultured Helicobacter sp.]|uniref:chromosomal replication initiator protein DnaA n=1 Tax=uncultured Helicobacter sp. TaxID=175537 RepID=UPI00374E5DEE